MAEINVTPFTDVLLVLMIVFILLTALVVPPGFEKDLANGCTPSCGETLHRPPSVDVSISPNGRIFVGTRVVDENDLYGALATIARHDAKTQIDLIGDQKAPYRLIIRTLDAAKAAGLGDVALITR